MTLTRTFWTIVATALLVSFFIAWHDAHADTNLALTCGVHPTRPTTCPEGWTWQTPVKNSTVVTQGGSWRTFTVPPNTTDVLTLCASDILPGAPRGGCPKIIYGVGCNAHSYSCGPPGDTTATVEWHNNSDDVVTNTLWRGTRADGSDLVAYKTLPVFVTFADRNLTPGMWCYAVTALNDAGESPKSNVACKAIVDNTKRIPAVPSNTTVK